MSLRPVSTATGCAANAVSPISMRKKPPPNCRLFWPPEDPSFKPRETTLLKIYGIYRSRATRNIWLCDEMGIKFQHVPVIQASLSISDALAAFLKNA